MKDHSPDPVSVTAEIEALRFLPDRTPSTDASQRAGAFRQLRVCRDGGIFIGHWAGASEWERHTAGDEVVMVMDGATTIFYLLEHGEESAALRAGDLVVVPEGTWHRFETPLFVKLLSVTPQPTDHSDVHPT